MCYRLNQTATAVSIYIKSSKKQEKKISLLHTNALVLCFAGLVPNADLLAQVVGVERGVGHVDRVTGIAVLNHLDHGRNLEES